MKLLSTILAAMILAPVSGLTCGTNVSNDCQAEWNNANNNNQLSAFWNRCKTEGGANPLRNRCKYCCYGDNAPKPTKKPAPCPTAKPTGKPSFRPTNKPTAKPTGKPSPCPTNKPTAKPTGKPSFRPTESPTAAPTANPTERPTERPSANPTESPTTEPSSMVTFDKYGETEAPYDKGVPTESPCPDDVELLNIKGDYPIDLEESVQILQQDTSSVTVRLVNAWTSKGETIDHIFYEYKESTFSEKCYEEQNVDGGEAYQDITIQCMHTVPIARLNICVADTDKNPLSELDDAEVPQCCHPDLPEDADVVCYNLEVHCESTCDPEEGKSEDSEDERTNTPTSAPTKNLRSPSPTSSPTDQPSASPTATPTSNPTDSPTLGSTESPTQCWEHIPPQIVSSQCYKMETESLPDNAIEVLNHNEDTVKVVIALPESDATGLAVRDDAETCDIVDGNTGEFEGECIDGYATFVIMVFKEEDFDKEECEACNYDDLEELEETFCAYSVEIPCESIPVDCEDSSNTESPESTEEPTVNENPTASPTLGSTESPTDCQEPNPPKITNSQCYKMETESLPDNAIEVLNHNEDTVKVAIALPESAATGLAVRDDSETCDIVDGNTGEFESECINGYATFVIMVFKEEEFSKEECEACNYDDLEELEETFCAYSVEIPCESIPCTTESPESTEEPTVNESPTAFPTFAPTVESSSDPTAEPTSNPTESPTTAPTAEPTSNPTESPTTAPTTAPTSNPTESPTMSPTLAPTDQPSDSPTAKAVTATESPSASPTIFEPQQGGCRKPPGCDPYAPGASASCMIEEGCPELTPGAYYPDPENCAAYCFSTGTNAPCRYEVVDKRAPQVVDPYGRTVTGFTFADIKNKNNAQCSKKRTSPLDGTCGITMPDTSLWGMWGIPIPKMDHCKYWPDRDGGKSGNLGTTPKPTNGL